MGYSIWPSPESLDVYKENKSARAQALGSLTSAGAPLLMSFDLLGYDLTPEQRAQLEEAEKKKEEQAEQMQEQLQQQPAQAPGQEEEQEEKPAPFQAKKIEIELESTPGTATDDQSNLYKADANWPERPDQWTGSPFKNYVWRPALTHRGLV